VPDCGPTGGLILLVRRALILSMPWLAAEAVVVAPSSSTGVSSLGNVFIFVIRILASLIGVRSVHNWAVWMEDSRRKAVWYDVSALDAFRRAGFSSTVSSGVSARNAPDWTGEERVDGGPASSRCCLVGEAMGGLRPPAVAGLRSPGAGAVRTVRSPDVASWEAFLQAAKR